MEFSFAMHTAAIAIKRRATVRILSEIMMCQKKERFWRFRKGRQIGIVWKKREVETQCKEIVGGWREGDEETSE